MKRVSKSKSDSKQSTPGKLSLAPLTPEQALLAAMNTKPPARKKSAKKQEKKP